MNDDLPLRWRVPGFRDPRLARAFPPLCALAAGAAGSAVPLLSPRASLVEWGLPAVWALLVYIFASLYAAGTEYEVAERFVRANGWSSSPLRRGDVEIFWGEVRCVDWSEGGSILSPSEGPIAVSAVVLRLPDDPDLRARVVREIEARTAHARHNP